MRNIVSFFAIVFMGISCKKSVEKVYFEIPGRYIQSPSGLFIGSDYNGSDSTDRFFDYFSWPGAGDGYFSLPLFNKEQYRLTYLPIDSLVVKIDSMNWQLQYMYAHINPRLLGKPLFMVKDITADQIIQMVVVRPDSMVIKFAYNEKLTDSIDVKNLLNGRLLQGDTSMYYQ